MAGLPWPEGTAIHLVTAYEVPIDWTDGVGAGMAWVGDAKDALRDELADVADWVGQYRRHWEESFERLDTYLRDPQDRQEEWNTWCGGRLSLPGLHQE
ncbi:MAG: hypothetical protein WEE67_10090 [Chloroflexota bacterium]